MGHVEADKDCTGRIYRTKVSKGEQIYLEAMMSKLLGRPPNVKASPSSHLSCGILSLWEKREFEQGHLGQVHRHLKLNG